MAAAPESCQAVVVPQSRAVHTPTQLRPRLCSEAFGAASLPTATTRDRRRLLIAAVREEVLGMRA